MFCIAHVKCTIGLMSNDDLALRALGTRCRPFAGHPPPAKQTKPVLCDERKQFNSADKMSEGTQFARSQQKLLQEWFIFHGQVLMSGSGDT